jgi:protein gp37
LSVEPLLEDIGALDLSEIDWVIVGGESGPGARAMAPSWVRNVRDQCKDSRVPFFFKQWGGVRKGEAGRRLDGRFYSEFPVRPKVALPDETTRAAALRDLSQLVR